MPIRPTSQDALFAFRKLWMASAFLECLTDRIYLELDNLSNQERVLAERKGRSPWHSSKYKQHSIEETPY